MQEYKQAEADKSQVHLNASFATFFSWSVIILVRGDVRIIRGCGYEEDPKGRDCYTTVLEEYNTEVCACKEDGCNSATG